MFIPSRLVSLYVHLAKLYISSWHYIVPPPSLDLPVALRHNDSLQSLHLHNIPLVSSVPSIGMTEDELRFMRTLEECDTSYEMPDVLLECVVRHLELNGGQMPNLKWLFLSRSNLALVACVVHTFWSFVPLQAHHPSAGRYAAACDAARPRTDAGQNVRVG